MALGSVQLRGARTLEEFRDRIRDFAAKLPKGRTDHTPPRHRHWIGNTHNPSKNGAALVPV